MTCGGTMLDVAFEIGGGATPTATASSWQSPEARVASQSSAIHTTTGAPIGWGNSVEQKLGNAPFESPAGCFSDDEAQRRQDFSRATRPLHPCNTPAPAHPPPAPAPPHPTPPHHVPAPLPPHHTPPPRPRPMPSKKASMSMTAVAAFVAITVLLAVIVGYIVYSSRKTSSPQSRSPFIQSSYF